MRSKIAIALGFVLLSACGSKNNGDPNVQFFDSGNNARPDMMNGDTGGRDAGSDAAAMDIGTDMPPEEDMNDGDVSVDMSTNNGTNNMLCGGEMCGDAEECRNDICFVVESCAGAIDLGELTADAPLNAEGNLATGADTLTTTCGEDAQKERVYSFEVTEQLQVNWEATWMGQFDGLIELRGTCDDDGSVLSCRDVESTTTVLDPGTYFLVLEVRTGNPGNFSLDISAEEASCTPGMQECMGTQLQVCNDPTEPELFQCADNCTAMQCGGDTCGNALEVTAATSGVFTGHGGGYTSDLDFDGNINCTTSGGMPIATPGYEVVFFLPGLQQNDIVSIDADTNDSNVNAIFIVPACMDTAACVATYTDEQPDWVVDTPGDYYVIIDKLTASSTEFQYSVDVL